jgi:HEAT repeat protein
MDHPFSSRYLFMKKLLAPAALAACITLSGCSTTEQQVSSHLEVLAANTLHDPAWTGAVDGLSTIGRPAARQLVSQLDPAFYRGANYREHRDEIEKIRTGAALALGRIRHRGAAASLKDRITVAYRQSERLACIWALGEIGFNQAAFDKLKLQLKDADPQINLLSAVALLKMDDESGEAAIVTALSGSDNTLASTAIKALEETNYTAVNLLVRLSQTDGPLSDASRREQLTAALQIVKDRLIDQLNDEDPEIRRHSARALGNIGGTQVRQALLAGLEDPSNVVRFNAAASLAQMGDQEGSSFLFAALENTDPILRVNAVAFLTQVQQRSGTVEQPLIAALAAQAPLARAGAAQVLGQSRVHAAVPALIKTITDPVAQVRWNAIIALGHIGAAESRQHIEPLLKDEDRTVAYYAEWALNQFKRG